MTDIEIAQKAAKKPISQIAENIGIPPDALEHFGKYKAKLSLEFLNQLKGRPTGKLILVTAISPTPPGEGKTTTTVGLGDGLTRLGHKTLVCLREPCLGPVFGQKGGATGGGYAQVVPMEDINLHFTGDFSAVQLANNLLAALIDNHIHHGNGLGIDPRRITWKRVVDMNDRALRSIVVSLGGPANGQPRQDSFDIVVASEVMAILCLATSLDDLKRRLGNIVVGYTFSKQPVRASDLHAEGAMAVLLKDAIKPNLVQTLEHTPVFVHGGPFANIAHGCNSILATKTALQLADYVVTEAGFGADLGAEKFLNIKCRKAGIAPATVVIVATIRALKYHGGMNAKSLQQEDVPSLEKGLVNLERHLRNLHNQGLSCVVAINHFSSDTASEVALLQSKSAQWGVPVVLARHWAEGGAGAEDLARAVVDRIQNQPSDLRLLYDDKTPLWEKMRTIACSYYGAAEIRAEKSVRAQIQLFEDLGFGAFPVCVAKTQYSFSTDPKGIGAPLGHTIQVREVRLSAGAEFIVMVCGDINTMPGLPKEPAAHRIQIDSNGTITGLS